VLGRCAASLARGLLQTGRAVCGWKLRLSRGSPCRAATRLRPTCTRKRGEDPQHLPTSLLCLPPSCPLLWDAHAPRRVDTAAPKGSGLLEAFLSVSLCLGSAHVSLSEPVHAQPGCGCVHVVCVHTGCGGCQCRPRAPWALTHLPVCVPCPEAECGPSWSQAAGPAHLPSGEGRGCVCISRVL